MMVMLECEVIDFSGLDWLVMDDIVIVDIVGDFWCEFEE